MDEFGEIQTQLVNEAFADMTKVVESMSDAERAAYAERNPVRIWTVAGINEEFAFAISVN